ncbi:acyltransferase family protein [Demequina mangrovi]|uniref:Fucose 4-O-acetylase n=1 Tax=Demequina mangrovi TaxID=1043493 RepID=A0A1H6YG68_9MICO|nr:acyltransferase family protein [Demequina mangrovi]SEJ40241.1 Fucose 4-O-acetylase [Demequina mangrovi]
MSRDRSLDIAKGIAIIAIVAGHVWRGLNAAGVVNSKALFEAVDASLYMWHLTVFAFVAGLFVRQGLDREGRWAYAVRRDVTFLWLYMVWSIVQGAAKILGDTATNGEASPTTLLQLWNPDGQLWFLGWIAIVTLVAAALNPWLNRSGGWVVLAVAAAVSVATWGLNGPYLGTQGAALTGYYMVGVVWRGERFVRFQARFSTAMLSATAVASFTAMAAIAVLQPATPPTTGGATRDVESIVLGVLASTLGLVAVLAAARLLASGRRGVALAYIGARSMAVFLGHIVFAVGARAALLALEVHSLPVLVVVSVSVGVVGPLLLYSIADRLRVAWLFRAPEALTSRVVAR